MSDVIEKDQTYLSSIEDILDDARQGKMFILVDDVKVLAVVLADGVIDCI